MTEVALPTSSRRTLASDSAKARQRARYRAEARFKAYGLAAIAATAVFIAAVLGDIVVKGLPAFWQQVVVLNVAIDPEVLDPDKVGIEIAMREGDYQALARSALRAQFPDVKDRVGRRQLDGLLSTAAGDAVRDRVVADPKLVGQSVQVQLLLSDDADLYYKGASTKIIERQGRGVATPSDRTGDVTVALSADNLASGLPPALQKRLADQSNTELLDSSTPSLLIALNGGLVKVLSRTPDGVAGNVLLPLTNLDPAASGAWRIVSYATPEANRRVNDREIAFLERLRERGAVVQRFNWAFFTNGDSREPELAGIRGALTGSAITLLITLLICVPLGVAAAIYLEEFAPRNRITEVIEVNINNLAAVPSIVFGLLGLAVFLNFFGLPRSAPLVGGLVLALLVLPTIIIASRAALRAVPPSIKEAALGVGASQQQAIFHHILPLAMPGILTGTIIGMAHALGETAPLLMIGMVAFIVESPQGITDAATVLPVQIYLWSDLPEIAFQAKTAAAIMVLLVFLFAMNGIAIVLRKRFERRW